MHENGLEPLELYLLATRIKSQRFSAPQKALLCKFETLQKFGVTLKDGHDLNTTNELVLHAGVRSYPLKP